MIILSNMLTESQSTSYLEMAFQLIFLIFIFGVVIFLAYYSTKFVAGAKMKTMSKNNMKVIETISIGLNHIHIIKVNKQYFLVSSSKEGIRMLSEINGEDLILNEKINQFPFDEQLKNHINNIKNKKGGKYEK